ncbi:MAG: flippase-like domain-containing protein [Anaerolineae bacterium]|nr:flippase-like domain-containing protein [Anaerolineae bacterium]
MIHHSSDQKTKRGALIALFKRHRSRLLVWLRLAVTVGLLAFVFSLVAGEQEQVESVDWTLIPLAWTLMLLSTAVKSVRWGLLVHQSRMNLPFRRLFGSYLVGAFFSTVLPTSVGGDAVRAVDTANATGRGADSTSSVLIERGIGLLVVIGSGSIFAMFMDRGTVPLPFVLLVHAMFIGSLAGIVMLRQGWLLDTITKKMRRYQLGGVADKLHHLNEALSEHLGSPVILVKMVGLSIIANALTMGATYLVLVAVTEPAPVSAFVPMIALATTAELIPISIASLGVKESAYVFFLGLISVGGAEAGMLAIIMRTLTWGHALLGGLIYLNRTMGSASQDRTARA